MYWCAYCKEWVESEEMKDQDGNIYMGCPFCGNDSLQDLGDMIDKEKKDD